MNDILMKVRDSDEETYFSPGNSGNTAGKR
jgi:hypothetical protein